jgi:hypothetical protein
MAPHPLPRSVGGPGRTNASIPPSPVRTGGTTTGGDREENVPRPLRNGRSILGRSPGPRGAPRGRSRPDARVRPEAIPRGRVPDVQEALVQPPPPSLGERHDRPFRGSGQRYRRPESKPPFRTPRRRGRSHGRGSTTGPARRKRPHSAVTPWRRRGRGPQRARTTAAARRKAETEAPAARPHEGRSGEVCEEQEGRGSLVRGTDGHARTRGNSRSRGEVGFPTNWRRTLFPCRGGNSYLRAGNSSMRRSYKPKSVPSKPKSVPETLFEERGA